METEPTQPEPLRVHRATKRGGFSELDRVQIDESSQDLLDELREVDDPDEGDDPGQLTRV